MKKSTAGRTIYYYGRTFLKHWPFFFLGILTSFGYTYCLTFLNAQAVSDIIDRVSGGGVNSDNVITSFLPAIIMLVLANVIGQNRSLAAFPAHPSLFWMRQPAPWIPRVKR